MGDDFPVILTLSDAAKILLTAPENLQAELKAGRLRGFRVGDEWRVTKRALLEFVGEQPAHAREENASKPVPNHKGEIDMSNLVWKPAAPFIYEWPKRASDPVPNGESFDKAVETEIKVSNKTIPMKIAFTNREAAGQNRRRAVVFLKNMPAVEFTGADDFNSNGLLASVVKGRDGKHIRSAADLPAEYATMPVDIYTNLITGPYAARSVAVVANEEDYTLMARHALVRAQWKGWLG